MALPNESLQERPLTEKPVSSLRVLFLTYITDLTFSAVVFAVFLLATWGLHYLGNTLAITWFRFYWGVFELLFISFGTLLCILFLLKATVEFTKNLIRQLQQSVEGVGGELLRLNPGDITRRFVEPLRKQPIRFVICSTIVMLFLFLWISFAEIIQDDSDDVLILACEMLCETGPDFLEPAENHAKMLATYSKYLEGKYLASLLRIFHNYTPEKVLSATSETLSNAVGSQEEAANKIWWAGENIMLFRLKSPKFLPRWIRLNKYRRAPKWLLNDIAVALRESEKALELFDNMPTLANAVYSCERNRKTMLLLFLVRSNYNRPEVASLFKGFREVVEAGSHGKTYVANRLQDDDPRTEFMIMTANFDRRRIDMLDALEVGNMQEAINLMWKSIEVASSRRQALLELCRELRGHPSWDASLKPH